MSIITRPARPIKGIRSLRRPEPATGRPQGNPRDSWPAWTDERWTTGPERSDLDLTSFAGRIEPFRATPEQAAEALGLTLAATGIAASPIEGWPVEVTAAFRLGHQAGCRIYAADVEADAFQAEQAHQVGAIDRHPSEAVEALGWLAPFA